MSWSFTEELEKQQFREAAEDYAKDYGKWIIKNCIVTQTGFRTHLENMWTKEISNERAYELYLESLKST